MEELKPITEVEVIKGREFDVVKTPRYSETEQETMKSEYATAIENMESWANIANDIKRKIDKF